MTALGYSYNNASNKFGETTLVGDLTDFPAPDAGIIYLPGGTSWILAKPVDLQGNRIVCEGTVAIQGVSAETASLTSTGLGAGLDVIFTEYTLQMRDLRFDAPANCRSVHIDGSGQVLKPACDWAYINFFGPGDSVLLNDVDNAIMNTCLTFGNGWEVLTNINTLAFTESLFLTTASGQCSVCIDPAATVSRRLRLNNCALVAALGSTSLDVPSSTIQNAEGFIVDLCEFTGDGTRITGTTFLDDAARWIENRGITNTARIAEYTWQNNATATTIPAQDTYVKVAGVSTAGANNQRFSHEDNRATYISELQELFQITATCNVTGGNNRIFSVIGYLNGVTPIGVPQKSTTNGLGRAESVMWQGLVQLGKDDYIEIWIANNSNDVDLTVEDLSVQVLQA